MLTVCVCVVPLWRHLERTSCVMSPALRHKGKVSESQSASLFHNSAIHRCGASPHFMVLNRQRTYAHGRCWTVDQTPNFCRYLPFFMQKGNWAVWWQRYNVWTICLRLLHGSVLGNNWTRNLSILSQRLYCYIITYTIGPFAYWTLFNKCAGIDQNQL